MFRHPSYYKKLRASLREKAISPNDTSTDGQGRTPKDPSAKLQAPSIKLSNQPVQSPSDKHPNQSNKRQASSRK
jgi:hypothetical protein